MCSLRLSHEHFFADRPRICVTHLPNLAIPISPRGLTNRTPDSARISYVLIMATFFSLLFSSSGHAFKEYSRIVAIRRS
jgi:hypothetical protein